MTEPVHGHHARPQPPRDRPRLADFRSHNHPVKDAAYWDAAAEQKRDAINNWILTSGAFDGVVDFASVLADPYDPDIMNPIYDSGDHLHPSDAGYVAMGDAINLEMLLHR